MSAWWILPLVLGLAGATPALATASAAQAQPRELTLQDFERGDSLPARWTVFSQDWRGHRYRPAGAADGVGVRVERFVDASRGSVLSLGYEFADAQTIALGWGLRLDRLDASRYDHLSFWIRGDPSAGYARTFKIEFRQHDPNERGQVKTGSFVVSGIGDGWQRVLVPLNRMTGIRDWTGITEFVVSFHSRRAPQRSGTYFIDDIALVRTGKPGPSIDDKVVTARKDAWEAALGGKDAARRQLHRRLVGWPTRALVDKASLPRDEREFLKRLARDTWRGLDALVDREHGLPLDTVRVGDSSAAPEQARIGDYTNITNIGLHMIAVAGALELGLISRPQALDRLGLTLRSLERMQTYRGFFYNYYDTTSLERTSHFVSLVDSAWLTAGLMVVRMSFPELHARCSRLIDRGDYGFFYDHVEQQLSHGYYVNLASPSEYRYGALFAESRIGSLIAIGKADVPREHWFRMLRTLPEDHAWQSLPPRDRRPKQVAGYEVIGGYYQWRDQRYVPSWGGSMFEALMPTLVLDEQAHAPRSLGRNGVTHAQIQQRYALEDLGYPVWGLSPSATPEGDGYGEYGVKVLGSRGYGAGAVTPHAAALALSVTPEAAVANLLKLAELYDIYGEFGFYDAVDPRSGKVAHKYLALDQSMLFIALVNHLRDRWVQRQFASDPIAANALPLLRDEDFLEQQAPANRRD
jgi:hypothetical protein